MKNYMLSASFALCLFSVSAPAQHTIDKVAPENTVLVMGARSVANSMERVKNTSLWNLWQSKEMTELRKTTVEDLNKALKGLIEETGINEDKLKPPTGPMGFAVFSVMDEEIGMPSMGLLMTADYGSDAEQMHEMIKTALENAEKDSHLRLDEDDLLGHKVLSVHLPKLDNEEDEDDFGAMGMGMPDLSGLLGDMDTLHLVRVNNTFLMSTDLASLRGAIEKAEGGGRNTLAGRDDFRTIMDQVGAENDAYIVMLTRDVAPIISANDPMGITMLVLPLLRTAFGELDGIGAGMRMDGPTAMIEQNVFISMPRGKAGLTKLVTRSSPVGKIPHFVSPDAIGVNRINVDFQSVAGTIRTIARAIPMIPPQQMEQLDGFVAILDGFMRPLGNEMYIVSTLTRPVTETSSGQLVAIQCKNPQEFENALSQFGPQLGMKPRDFLGQRIYSMPAPSMPGMGGGAAPDMSLGIGGGYVLFGASTSVEGALRSVGQKDASSLAESSDFTRALSAMQANEVVGWGYLDIVSTMEASVASQEAATKRMIEEMREFDEDYARELEAEMASQKKMLDTLSPKLLRKYIGPSIWQLQSNDKGFVMKSYTMAATAN